MAVGRVRESEGLRTRSSDSKQGEADVPAQEEGEFAVPPPFCSVQALRGVQEACPPPLSLQAKPISQKLFRTKDKRERLCVHGDTQDTLREFISNSRRLGGEGSTSISNTGKLRSLCHMAMSLPTSRSLDLSVEMVHTDGLHFLLVKYMCVLSLSHNARRVPLLKLQMLKKKKRKNEKKTKNNDPSSCNECIRKQGRIVYWDNLAIEQFIDPIKSLQKVPNFDPGSPFTENESRRTRLVTSALFVIRTLGNPLTLHKQGFFIPVMETLGPLKMEKQI